MAYEHQEGSGALFPNKKREKDSHPHYQGDIMLGGVVYRIAGWAKVNPDGSLKLIGLKGEPKEDRQQADTGARTSDVDNDPIPF